MPRSVLYCTVYERSVQVLFGRLYTKKQVRDIRLKDLASVKKYFYRGQFWYDYRKEEIGEDYANNKRLCN
jgi:hypothetical protein